MRLAQARRALERAKAQQKVVVSQRQEDRRDIAQQPVHKRKQPAREKTPADGDREARQLANAQKQLQYSVKEQAALSRKLARVLALGHLDTLEATVAAKEALLADARAKGRELARAHKEQARALEHGRGDDPSRVLKALNEEVRVARERIKRYGEQQKHEQMLMGQHDERHATLAAEVAVLHKEAGALVGARRAAADAASRGDGAPERGGAAEARGGGGRGGGGQGDR